MTISRLRRIVALCSASLIVTLAGPSSAAEAASACVYLLTDRCESWASTYDGPAGLGDGAETMTISPDGRRVFTVGNRVMGRSGTLDDIDYGVIAYEAGTGRELWAAGYGGPGNASGNRHDYVADVATSPDGARVYVTGSSMGTGGSSDFDWATVAVDAASGERLWVRRYDGLAENDWNAAGGIESALVRGENDRLRELVFVSGGHIIAYDARTGAPMWTSQSDEEQDISVGDIVFVPDTDDRTGPVLLAQLSIGAAAFDPLTGDLRWSNYHESPSDSGSYGWAFAADPGGRRVYATGFSFHLSLSGGVSMDYLTAAFDTVTGQELWSATFDQDGGDDRAVDIAADLDGSRVYVTGIVEAAGGLRSHTVTIGYDAATGQQIWTDRYEGMAGAASAWRIAAGRDARVFVSAYSPFTVVSYDGATGRRQWAARYTPPGALDGAYALAPAPDGSRVYAAGAHFRPDSALVGGADMLTVAYDL